MTPLNHLSLSRPFLDAPLNDFRKANLRGKYLVRIHHTLSYFRLKLTSTLSETGTGSPFLVPGLNFHCSNASIAFSVSP
jgi:hypothetical protein